MFMKKFIQEKKFKINILNGELTMNQLLEINLSKKLNSLFIQVVYKLIIIFHF